jgi:hypothetical protein
MRHYQRLVLAFTAAALLGSTSRAAAQQKLSIEGHGGIAIPTSDLADLEDAGPSFGVGLTYDLSPRIAIRVAGDVDILGGVDSDGSGPEAPDMNIYHYNAGLGFRLLDPEAGRVTLDVNVGAGLSTLDVDSFSVGGQTVDFSETYFTANGGLKLGYDVAPGVNVFVGGQAYLIFSDGEDTAVFGQLRSDVDTFDTAWTRPLTVGLPIRI